MAEPRPDPSLAQHAQERFDARARALIYTRLGLMSIGLAVLMVPAWHAALNIPMPGALYAYLVVLAYHVASHLTAAQRWGRLLIFVTLCLDVLVLLYLVGATGGIKSPLMPTQLVFTVLFALLYPTPLAVVPPLITLPVLARLDQTLGQQTLPEDLLLLLWYTALNLTLVYVIVYLDGRERATFRELMALQGERRNAELTDQRIRIAREIHDGVGSAFSAVALQAEYLVEAVQDEELRHEVRELRQATHDGMEELRRAVSLLHREFRLAESAADLVAQVGERSGLRVELDVEGAERELAPELQLALFRVLQEALSNAARHARASDVRVWLRFEAARVVLGVRDDGQGFTPPESPEPGHYGLRNMRERLAKLNGDLRVTSAPGQGCEIVVEAPCRPADPASCPQEA